MINNVMYHIFSIWNNQYRLSSIKLFECVVLFPRSVGKNIFDKVILFPFFQIKFNQSYSIFSIKHMILKYSNEIIKKNIKYIIKLLHNISDGIIEKWFLKLPKKILDEL